MNLVITSFGILTASLVALEVSVGFFCACCRSSFFCSKASSSAYARSFASRCCSIFSFSSATTCLCSKMTASCFDFRLICSASNSAFSFHMLIQRPFVVASLSKTHQRHVPRLINSFNRRIQSRYN